LRANICPWRRCVVPDLPSRQLVIQCIDRYIKSCGKCIDRFDYEKDWPATLQWLAENSNPLLREAYRTGNIEQIFTVLDFAQSLHEESLIAIFRASKAGAVSAAERSHDNLSADFTNYENVRRILLWATEAYFLSRHEGELTQYQRAEWATLKILAEKLQPGDVVITFNYDATGERALFAEKSGRQKTVMGQSLFFRKAVTMPLGSSFRLHQ